MSTSTELIVPDSRDLILSLDSPTLYKLEEAGQIARDILDERVVGWTSEGWSQRQIAEEIGCTQAAVSKRQARLGVEAAGPQAGKTARKRDDNPVIIDPPAPKMSVADQAAVFASQPEAAQAYHDTAPATVSVLWSETQMRKDDRALELLAEARALREEGKRLTDTKAVAYAYREAAQRARRAATSFDEVAMGFGG